MSMRIKCNICNGLATINSSSEESSEVKKLYCSCNNPECGHTFVMNLEFSHTLSPSCRYMPESIREALKKANPMQQKELFERWAAVG